ncbi:hypothetical protein GCM10022382_28230 [Microbacterium invictum]
MVYVRRADGVGYGRRHADPSLTSTQRELLPSEDIDDRLSGGDGFRPEIVCNALNTGGSSPVRHFSRSP